eukprot:TRINITY_DN4922_c1_g2_i1.p1 TRINITY_DN4922_c1_g2~~TRINITY_DN4922_c1_g2_i1.p1  ORF type:complete len:458 (-),score=96.99 TRINITY_DN4922_c1_g2_i1:170-1543(-)
MSKKAIGGFEYQLLDRTATAAFDHDDEMPASRGRLNSPWYMYYAPFFQSEELQMLVQFDCASPETREPIFSQRSEDMISVLVTLVYRISKDDMLYYALNWIDQVHSFLPNLYDYIRRHLPEGITSPFQLFYRLLRRSHEQSVRLAAITLAKLIVSHPSSPHAQEHFNLLTSWMVESATKNQINPRVPVEALMEVLRNRSNRYLTAKMGTLQMLTAAIRTNIRPIRDIQLMYEAIFCVWISTYDPKVVEMEFYVDGYELVAVLVDVLRVAEKEKILRMSLAALRNLSSASKHIETMLAYGILKLLDTFSRKTWADEDIEDDIRYLREKIHAEKHVLSSFDHYQEEILSGHLQWSPVHSSETFWRENLKRFEEREFHLIKLLIQLLKTAENPQVLAVACHDLGEFVCYHPRGKIILQDLQAKPVIMGLMVHSHIEVQKQALLCTQKLMVKNWEFLSTAK